MCTVLGYILRVVMTYGHVEEIALRHFVTRVAVVDVLPASENVTYAMTRKVVRLNAVAVWLRILHNSRLLQCKILTNHKLILIRLYNYLLQIKDVLMFPKYTIIYCKLQSKILNCGYLLR